MQTRGTTLLTAVVIRHLESIPFGGVSLTGGPARLIIYKWERLELNVSNMRTPPCFQSWTKSAHGAFRVLATCLTSVPTRPTRVACAFTRQGKTVERAFTFLTCCFRTVISTLTVPTGPPSRGGGVAVYVFDKQNKKLFKKKKSLQPPYSVLVSFSVFMALSTVFHSIYSLDNCPLSHFVLPVLFLPCWTFQLYIPFIKVSLSPDIILCGWLLTNHFVPPQGLTCIIIISEQ